MLVTIVYRSTIRRNAATVNACPEDVNSVIFSNNPKMGKRVVSDHGTFYFDGKGKEVAWRPTPAARKAEYVAMFASHLATGTIKGNQITFTV